MFSPKLKYLFWPLVIAFLLNMVFLGGCGKQKPVKEQTSSTGEKKQIITLRLASTLPIGHHQTRSCDLFKKLVEERSKGKVKIEHYPAGQLYVDKDLVDVLPQGGVEMANINYGMWTGLVPEFGILDFVGLYNNPEHSYRVQDDPEVNKIIGKKLAEKGNAVILAWPGMEARGPLFVKPVKKLEDLKGLKMRAHSEYCTYWLKALGASPVLISSAEVYQALQRKTIDGVISGGTSYIDRKFIEVAKYPIGNVFTLYGPFALVINKNAWDKLPKDIQEIMLQAGKEVTAYCRAEAHKAEEAAWNKMESMPDVRVTYLSEEELKRWHDLAVPLEIKEFEKRVGKETAAKLLARVEALREK
ncbi:MAG: TRAP transporter substrate-binding protein [Peptococcaceae bacterium]